MGARETGGVEIGETSGGEIEETMGGETEPMAEPIAEITETIARAGTTTRTGPTNDRTMIGMEDDLRMAGAEAVAEITITRTTVITEITDTKL